MNKKELIAKVAENTGVKKTEATAVVDSIFGAITEAVAAGEKVSIADFGIFDTKHRAARTGRNPRTKETVEIPASTTPVFKPAKAFKEKVNG